MFLIQGQINMPNFLNMGFKHDYDASKEISSMLKMVENALSMKGLMSRDIVVMGHSAGGSVAQKWVHKNQDGFEQWSIVGQILMGSAVERQYIQIQEDGTSKVDFKAPIFSINGELDGLMRQSRVAEQAWHL
jgi:predicted esterase